MSTNNSSSNEILQILHDEIFGYDDTVTSKIINNRIVIESIIYHIVDPMRSNSLMNDNIGINTVLFECEIYNNELRCRFRIPTDMNSYHNHFKMPYNVNLIDPKNSPENLQNKFCEITQIILDKLNNPNARHWDENPLEDLIRGILDRE